MVSPNERWGLEDSLLTELGSNIFVAMAFRTVSCRSEKDCTLYIIPLRMLNSMQFIFTVFMHKEVQQKLPRALCRIPLWLTVF